MAEMIEMAKNPHIHFNKHIQHGEADMSGYAWT
jgi:hypothetical protein